MRKFYMKALNEHNMENSCNNCRFSPNSCGGSMNSLKVLF